MRTSFYLSRYIYSHGFRVVVGTEKEEEAPAWVQFSPDFGLGDCPVTAKRPAKATWRLKYT